MKQFLICLSLLIITSITSAKKLYKYQDEQGIWHYSDQPPKTAQEVVVRQLKVAQKKRVWLEKSGEDRHPEFYVRNGYFGPVEVEVIVQEQVNVYTKPKLPQRFVVQPGVSDKLFEVGGTDPYKAWNYTLKYRYVVGSSLAEHDISSIYIPPVAQGKDYLISQAFDGEFSHKDQQNQYAVDIVMPIGTPVHAARSGTVMEVNNDFFKGGIDNNAYRSRANSIRILHNDGSMGVYAHLALETAEVYPGLHVQAGQLIAYSGNTGFTTGPHLHFVVQVNQNMRLVSVPFKFINERGNLQVPVTGMWLSRLHTRNQTGSNKQSKLNSRLTSSKHNDSFPMSRN